MAVTITRTAWTDDDGSGTTGTIINNAEKTTLYGQIDAALAALPVNGTSLTAHGVLIGEGTSAVAVVGPDATVGKPLLSAGAAADPAFGDLGVAHGGTGKTTLTAHGVVIGEGTSAVNITTAGTAGQALRSGGASADPSFGEIVQTTTSTGTVNDFALTAGAGVLRCNNATLLTLTGIVAGFDGQRLVIVSVGAGQVDLSNQAAGSTAANRLINFATSAATSLAAGSGTAELEYDTTTARWRLVSHEQGAWITPTFAGGNWTAATGTWTVDSGDVLADKYYLKGRTLSFQITVATTSVSATPTTLSRSLYGFTAAATRFDGMSLVSDAGGANAAAQFTITASGTTVGFVKLAGNFAIAANNTTVFAQGVVEVT